MGLQSKQFLSLVALGLLSFCAQAGEPLGFTVVGKNGAAYIRWLTTQSVCPIVTWGSGKKQKLALRVGKTTVADRNGRTQQDSKPSIFNDQVCEVAWQPNESKAYVMGQAFQAPLKQYKRIALLGDTGCRMKASDRAFQDCSDKAAWPFSVIVESVTNQSPDLVVHLGDIHYRESPCPSERLGCRESPWGYGSDAWDADLFEPARKLLQTTPWLFVRGNHESCARAGQGWFRYIDSNPWQKIRSCHEPKHDVEADFSEPYAFQLNSFSQLVVFDSSATVGKRLSNESVLFKNYQQQLAKINHLLEEKNQSIFLSHHPLLAVSPTKENSTITPGGNKGLLSVFEYMNPEELIPSRVSYLMHGHIHAFEVLNFKSHHPASMVLGNSGSMMEGAPPEKLPMTFQVAPTTVIENLTKTNDFGFAMLEIPNHDDLPWKLSEFDIFGHPIIVCSLFKRQSTCELQN